MTADLQREPAASPLPPGSRPPLSIEARHRIAVLESLLRDPGYVARAAMTVTAYEVAVGDHLVLGPDDTAQVTSLCEGGLDVELDHGKRELDPPLEPDDLVRVLRADELLCEVAIIGSQSPTGSAQSLLETTGAAEVARLVGSDFPAEMALPPTPGSEAPTPNQAPPAEFSSRLSTTTRTSAMPRGMPLPLGAAPSAGLEP